MESADKPLKPFLRGVLHQNAAWYALGAGTMLVAIAGSARAAAAAAIYTTSLIVLFAVSAVYHRIDWKTQAARARMRRADHASIFLLIAGSYTPVSLLALEPADGQRLLTIIWIGAAIGVLVSILWVHSPKIVTTVLAVALGWTITPYFPQVRALLGTGVWLVLGGGIAYTAGAVIYAVRRPDPWPRVFGYHEIFHALTLVGALLHLAVIFQIVRAS